MTQDFHGISNPKLILFTAPSGAGKTTIVHRLLDIDSRLAFSVSACTRKKRDYEIEGQHYHFLTEEEFKRKIQQDEFVEWEEVYPGAFYGTLYSEIKQLTEKGKAVLFDIDVKGSLSIKKKFGNRALAIFIKPPSLEILKERLRNRKSENDETLAKRLERADYEMTFENKFDAVVINDSLEHAVQEAEKLIGKFLQQP
jgi:guanylate kinase